jgi:hypothetical protein
MLLLVFMTMAMRITANWRFSKKPVLVIKKMRRIEIDVWFTHPPGAVAPPQGLPTL